MPALKCGINNFGATAGGGDQSVFPIVAIAVAFAKFLVQLNNADTQAKQFIAQTCPDGCPKKASVGPNFSKTKFSLNFSRKLGTWQAGFSCVVTARVTCK
jgi:hypothetical protein